MEQDNWAKPEDVFKLKKPEEKLPISDTGFVIVKGLSCGEKDQYENDVIKFEGRKREVRMANARAVLIQRCVYNQHGNRFFSEKDIGRINTIPAFYLDSIYDAARRLSGMLTGGIDEVEDLVKNSEKIRDCGSDTGSPDTSDAQNQN